MQGKQLQEIYKELRAENLLPDGHQAILVEKTGINRNSVYAALNGRSRVYVSIEAKNKILLGLIQILFEIGPRATEYARELQNSINEAGKN